MKQIDYLKAISILCVIILHTVSKDFLLSTYSQLHIWNAVPIFIVLMAFTTYISLSKFEVNLKEYYNKHYFLKRLKRLLIPAVPISLMLLLLSNFSNTGFVLDWKYLIGKMPIGGKGDYFITLSLEYMLISPLLFYTFKKHKKISLGISLILNLLFELICSFTNSDGYLYGASIFRYLFLIYLGFYLYEIISEKAILLKIEKILFLLGFVISTIYLILVNSIEIPFFINSWKTQIFIQNFYVIGLVYFLFKVMNNKFDKTIIIGRASYHIFLVQMVYFIVNPINIILNRINLSATFELLISVLLNIVICITFGIVYFKINNIFLKNRNTTNLTNTQ